MSSDRQRTGYVLKGRVIDGTGAPPIEDGAVVVVADRVEWVGRASELPANVADAEGREVLDFTGRTIMPGLVDAHLHISFGDAQTEEEVALYTPVEYRTLKAAHNARKVLRAGVTSASDVASTYNIGVAIRDAVEAGIVEGPRLSAAGPQLTTRQGLEDAFPAWMGVPEGQAGVLVRSRDEILEAIRLQVKNGVDVIKVSGSNDSAVSEQPLAGAAFRQDEFDLIAEETHRLGKVCTVHARTSQAVKMAARAGFDWIMHASYMDDEGLELVAERNIPIVAAMTLLVNIVESSEGTVGASMLDVFKAEIEAASKALAKAHEAGVPLIAGSESGWSLVAYGEWHAREMELLVTHAGLSPLEAIHAGTRAAAFTVPPWRDDIGSLEPGRFADILVVDGDPSEDIRVLQQKSRFEMLLKAGEPVDLTPVPERKRVYSFERVKLYHLGRFVYDEESGKGRAAP